MKPATFVTMKGAGVEIYLLETAQSNVFEFRSMVDVENDTGVEMNRVCDLFGPKALVTVWPRAGVGMYYTCMLSQRALPGGWLELAREAEAT